MSARRVICSVSFLCLWLAGSAQAQTDSPTAQKYAGEFLKLGVGARALGMGGAFVGLADDASAGYWNPAGLAFLDRHSVMLAHSSEFGEVLNYDFGAFVQPLTKGQNLTISIVRLSLDNIPVTDSLRTQTGSGGAVEPIYDENRLIFTSDHETALLMSYGKAASSKLSLGGTVKLIRQSVDDHSSFGMGADLGVIYSPQPSVSFGLALDDITDTFLSWDTGRREHITPSLRVGTQMTRGFGADHLLTVAGDIYATFDGRRTASQFSIRHMGGEFHAGAEYWFHRALALRAGVNHGDFTAGAGGRRGRFALDYAYISNSGADLQNTHRVSGSVDF